MPGEFLGVEIAIQIDWPTLEFGITACAGMVTPIRRDLVPWARATIGTQRSAGSIAPRNPRPPSRIPGADL